MLVVGVSFFKHVDNVAHESCDPEHLSSFVDVGGGSDSGFRSVAVGLLELLATRPRGHGTLINLILNQYFLYFPEYREKLPLLMTAFERWDALCVRLSLSEFVQTLAYSLRQMSIDKMCQEPLRYRLAFVGRFETQIASMRETKTRLHHCSLEALADALSTPIVLYLGREGAIRIRHRFHHQASNAFLPLILQMHDEKVMPKVHQSEKFMALKGHAVREFKRTLPHHAHPTLDELQVIIKEAFFPLQSRFLDVHGRLSKMLDVGELSINDLTQMYVKSLSRIHVLNGCVASVEHGSAAFFDGIMNPSNLGAQQADIIIQALARSVAIGQIMEEDLFDCFPTKGASKQTQRVMR